MQLQRLATHALRDNGVYAAQRLMVGRRDVWAIQSRGRLWEAYLRQPARFRRGLQRESKALTRMRSWSRCERALLSIPGTASRFNRYDERCKGVIGEIAQVQGCSFPRGEDQCGVLPQRANLQSLLILRRLVSFQRYRRRVPVPWAQAYIACLLCSLRQ